jgi:hypothetical protein
VLRGHKQPCTQPAIRQAASNFFPPCHSPPPVPDSTLLSGRGPCRSCPSAPQPIPLPRPGVMLDPQPGLVQPQSGRVHHHLDRERARLVPARLVCSLAHRREKNSSSASPMSGMTCQCEGRASCSGLALLRWRALVTVLGRWIRWYGTSGRRYLFEAAEHGGAAAEGEPPVAHLPPRHRLNTIMASSIMAS